MIEDVAMTGSLYDGVNICLWGDARKRGLGRRNWKYCGGPSSPRDGLCSLHLSFQTLIRKFLALTPGHLQKTFADAVCLQGLEAKSLNLYPNGMAKCQNHHFLEVSSIGQQKCAAVSILFAAATTTARRLCCFKIHCLWRSVPRNLG